MNTMVPADPGKDEAPEKQGTYQCANCLEVYEKYWSDEEAEKEYVSNFPSSNAASVEQAVVCDDCYKRMVAWKDPRVADREEFAQEAIIIVKE